MNRRGFLKMFAGAGVVAATNPVHFLAPAGGWGPKIYSFKDVAGVVDVYGTTGMAFLEGQLEYAAAMQVPVARLFGKTWARDIPIIGDHVLDAKNYYIGVAKTQENHMKSWRDKFLGEWDLKDEMQTLQEKDSLNKEHPQDSDLDSYRELSDRLLRLPIRSRTARRERVINS